MFLNSSVAIIISILLELLRFESRTDAHDSYRNIKFGKVYKIHVWFISFFQEYKDFFTWHVNIFKVSGPIPSLKVLI